MAGEAAPPFATDAGRPSPGPTAGAAEPPATAGDLPLIEEAALHLYRLYDLGYGIDLERARATLVAPSARMRPVLTRGASIDMPEPPLVVSLGESLVALEGMSLRAHIDARVYDLGIVALRLVVDLPAPLTWDRAADLLGEALGVPQRATDLLAPTIEALRRTLRLAVERPNATPLVEDYAALVVARLGPGTPAARLGAHPSLLRASLGERHPLGRAAAALATTLSYYEDDLILLTWSAAIVVDSDPTAREDATFLLEVANAQLLAFRAYDAQVARDLREVAPRLRRTRRLHWWELGAATRFQYEIHSLILDSVETSARAENALKVTEDVYWNRVYAAAHATLRLEVWRRGTERTLDALERAAALIAGEAAAARTLLLEWLIIALIAVELLVAIVGLRH